MMKRIIEKRRHFPDPRLPTIDGIVAMGDDLETDILLEAYSFGIFPWPHPELPCLWFCPDDRGVIDFRDLHVPRSLQKFLKKNSFKVTFDLAFADVMRACASVPRPGQDGTWITEPILRAYRKFHEAGYAHSCEVWHDDQLVGGIYGVYVGGVFSGESMFFRESNASKVALISLIRRLQSLGLEWMDIQMLTSVTSAFGGRYISKPEFLERVKLAHTNAKLQDWEHGG